MKGNTVKTRKIIIIVLSATILLFIVGFFIIRENILRKAEYKGNEFRFDGIAYEEIDYKEIEPYKETYKVVCKTTDGDWTLYEIEEYPDCEYLVARCCFEARVIKKVND